MSAQSTGRRTRLGALVGLCCAILALGPGLGPGYLLFYDMVFVPRLPLSERTLGIDGSVPRAVPGDLVVALGSQLAPGWVVQKLLLLLVFVGVGAGAASFFSSRVGAIAAAVAAAWNPYVGERLAIGHWGFLLGYACLPFLARAVLDHRRDPDAARLRLLGWTLLTALTGSTGAVLGLLVTLVLLLVPGPPAHARTRVVRAATPLGAFILANAAWWFPFIFLAPRDAADPAGVTAFMSRADTPLGVFASVLTGGGIWNEGVWFGDRSALLVASAALVAVIAVLVVAARAVVRRPELLGGAFPAIAVAGVLGLLIACASAMPGGREAVTWVVTTVPGGGLLRDSQKFVAPWMLAVALASGITAERASSAVSRVGAAGPVRAAVAALAVLWPVATFPGMAFGAGGAWQATRYPAGFAAMAQRIDALPEGKVAVFPWNLYRRYPWNHDVVTLDPWQRLLDREVLVNDDLPLSDRVVRGESADAARIGRAVTNGGDVRAALRASGVRFVLVAADQPAMRSFDAKGLTPIATEPGLVLYRLDGDVAPSVSDAAWWRCSGLLGLASAIGWFLATAAAAALRARRGGPTDRTRE